MQRGVIEVTYIKSSSHMQNELSEDFYTRRKSSRRHFSYLIKMPQNFQSSHHHQICVEVNIMKFTMYIPYDTLQLFCTHTQCKTTSLEVLDLDFDRQSFT